MSWSGGHGSFSKDSTYILSLYELLAEVPGIAWVNKKIMIPFLCPFSPFLHSNGCLKPHDMRLILLLHKMSHTAVQINKKVTEVFVFAFEVQFVQTQPMHINEQTVVSFWSRRKWGFVLNYVLRMPSNMRENVCRLIVLHNFLEDTFGSNLKLIGRTVIHCWCIEFCVVECHLVLVRKFSTMNDHILFLSCNSQEQTSGQK